MRAAGIAALALAAPAIAAEPAAGEASEQAFDPWSRSARYAFEYRVALDAIPAEPGDRVRLWLPAPAETASQDRIGLRIEAPLPATRSRDALGNHIVHLAWQGPAAEGSEVVVRALVERRPSRGATKEAVEPGSPDDPSRFLAPSRRVPLDGLIARLAEQESRGLESDREKIRAFYDHVTSNLRYSKHGEGWGRGDAIWVCTSKYGNCTDFHSLFLGMARSQQIPARFVIGFPVPAPVLSAAGKTARVPGYHCWSEAWDPGDGWLPVDASEAWKTRRFDDYFGAIPSDRIAFTTGRDLRLVPPQEGEPLNFFIDPYAEVDGKPVEGLGGRYAVRRLPSGEARRESQGASKGPRGSRVASPPR